MTSSYGRHRLALLALGAIGALVISASPAVAEPAPTFTVALPDLGIAHPDGKDWSLSLWPHGNNAPVLSEATVRIDGTALTGIATVTARGGRGTCRSDGAVTTCTVPNLPAGQDSPLALPVLHFQPAESANVGQHGTVTITVTSPGTAPAIRTSTITISEPVDLAAGDQAFIKATPGETPELPFVLRNVGDTAVRGAELTFQSGPGLVPRKHYSNCRYTPYMTHCRFDDELAPGTEYRLAEPPLAVASDIESPASSGVAYWWETAGDAAESAYYEQFFNDTPVAGTDAPLRLVRANQPRNQMRANGQTDVNPADNESVINIDITGDNRPDPAAVGAVVSGEVGATVKVKVGVKNLGPARMEDRISLGTLAPWTADVTVPTGTATVDVPAECRPVNADGTEASPTQGKLGAPRYLCTWTKGLLVGQEHPLQFTLRIDQTGERLGAVSVVLPNPEFGEVRDRDKTNNTAPIVVNAAAGSGGGPGTGGTGGGLPVTGASAGLLVGAGMALVTLGGAGFVIARRRRNTFVA